MTDERVVIAAEVDIAVARQRGRALAEALGMSEGAQTMVATAISELARNIVVYATRGEIILSTVTEGPRIGLQVVAMDEGPGIADLDLALQDGYSTAGSLGLGLPGARRLMDDFVLDSVPSRGTTVTMRKWLVA